MEGGVTPTLSLIAVVVNVVMVAATVFRTADLQRVLVQAAPAAVATLLKLQEVATMPKVVAVVRGQAATAVVAVATLPRHLQNLRPNVVGKTYVRRQKFPHYGAL
jgi:hypothetical protein